MMVTTVGMRTNHLDDVSGCSVEICVFILEGFVSTADVDATRMLDGLIQLYDINVSWRAMLAMRHWQDISVIVRLSNYCRLQLSHSITTSIAVRDGFVVSIISINISHSSLDHKNRFP